MLSTGLLQASAAAVPIPDPEWILVFSGSFYLLRMTGEHELGAITPIGGAALIAAWAWLAWKLIRR